LFRMGFQIELSCLERLVIYLSKDASLKSCSWCFSMLLSWLNFHLFSGECVFCQMDLALLFSAINFFILSGMSL
jgi:hypothetical protein